MTLPDSIVLLGVNMLFVAAVLFVIALNAQGKVGQKETAAMCLLTGSVNTISAFYYGLVMGDPASMAGNFLFGFTYLYFAFNILTGSDTYTGLGNYCLFVVLTCVPFFIVNLQAGAYILAFFWLIWGFLWGVFWVANGLKRNLGKLVPAATYFVTVPNFLVAVFFIFGWANPKGFTF